MGPLEPFERKGRAVAHHRWDHMGEVQAEFRDAGSHPDHDDQQLERDDHVDERQHGEEEHRRQVLLSARGQEDGLVPQPDHDQQHHRDDQQRGVHQTGCVVRQRRRQRIAVYARHHQRHDHADDQGQVKRDVKPGPPVAGSEGDPPPGPQPDRPGPRPIQDASHHRLGLAGQRPPRPREADGFQQHRPQDDLLVDDRLIPPLRNMPERRQPGGQRGHHDGAQRIEEHELDDVDGVHHPRHAVPVVDPVQREDLHALQERAR